MADAVRESFVARFGEDQAAAIEAAGQGHYVSAHHDPIVSLAAMTGEILASLVHGAPTDHTTDDFGTYPFRYWFLVAIGWECMTKYRDEHGITVPLAELKTWSRSEAHLDLHDGDFPDNLARAAGQYDDWMT